MTVNNTYTQFVIETFLECKLNLDRIRDILVEKGWMNADNYFLNKNFVFVDKTIEKKKMLQDILVENVLNIGHPNNEE